MGESKKSEKQLMRERIEYLENRLDKFVTHSMCQEHCDGKCNICEIDRSGADDPKELPRGCIRPKLEEIKKLQAKINELETKVIHVEIREENLLKQFGVKEMGHLINLFQELGTYYAFEIKKERGSDNDYVTEKIVNGVLKELRRLKKMKTKSRTPEENTDTDIHIVHAIFERRDKYIKIWVFFEYQKKYWCIHADDAYWKRSELPILAMKEKGGGWRIAASGLRKCELNWFGDPVVDVNLRIGGNDIRLWSSNGMGRLRMRVNDDRKTDVEVPFAHSTGPAVRWEVLDDREK